MREFLLDTNVLSELTRPTPHPRVVANVAATENRSAIAAITWHELRFGVGRMAEGRRRRAVAALIDDVGRRYPVLPYDARAALWHADRRTELERRGLVAPTGDAQMAAIAATNGMCLVTRNVADFRVFTDVEVLDWWTG